LAKIWIQGCYKNPEKSLHLKADSMYRYGEDRIVFLKMDSSRTYWQIGYKLRIGFVQQALFIQDAKKRWDTM